MSAETMNEAMKVLRFKGWFGSLSVLILSMGLWGCNPLIHLGFALPPYTAIQELDEQTGGSTLYLRGKVNQIAPFLDSAAYQLQDDTGSVWVLTHGALPQSGEEIIIKGQVEFQSILIAGQELGEFYVLQLEQVQNGESIPTEAVPEPSATPDTDSLFFPHKRSPK